MPADETKVYLVKGRTLNKLLKRDQVKGVKGEITIKADDDGIHIGFASNLEFDVCENGAATVFLIPATPA